MALLRRTIVILLLFVTLNPCLRAQQDTVAADSIINRIRVILEEYNDRVFFVDTSDYVTLGYDADDINLQIASSMGACNEIVKLYARGADVNNMAGGNATPLHYAVASGIKEAVEILLLLGAKPDKYDIFGNTPLISAVRANDLEIAELLIRYGASVSQADRNGSTPLHHAAALGYFYIADMLLYYDAPVDPRDIEGNTPLMAGVTFGFYDICDILLRDGADPNATDKKGFTPLMAAAQNGDTLMLRILCDAGANLYAFNHYGLDALGCAVRSRQKEAVTFLLNEGNRWIYDNTETKNPAKIAEYYGYRELLPLLADNGLRRQKKLSLEEMTLSAGSMFTSHYMLFSGSVSLTEPHMRAGITAGTAFNPFKWRLLSEGESDIIYQYKVSTSMIYAGIFKEFLLAESITDNKLSLIPSLAGGYMFHSFYEGTNDKPKNSFRLIPSGELRWNSHNIGLSAGVSYLKTPYYKVLPLWFSLRLSYTLVHESMRAPGKKTRLYHYE
jgi:ankyrin repeat protein